jgi:hypothetical protein
MKGNMMMNKRKPSNKRLSNTKNARSKSRQRSTSLSKNFGANRTQSTVNNTLRTNEN